MAFSGYRRHLNHLPPPPSPPLTTSKHSSNLLNLHYTEEFDDKNFQIKNQTLFYIFILFALTLLITLIILYARWFFRFRHLHTTSSAANAPHAPPSCAKGLDSAFIKAMPIILHQGIDVCDRDDDVECCICLGVFEEGDKVKVLNECQHRFHSDCVDRWLGGQATCPLCRVSIGPLPLLSDLELAEV
ncbi:hypothetical protein RND81_03G165000 [Saponaria officinalis]|uniref:RING-type E3 ubiquitin transferase n=1 Tax=Saponaria officinalis TaxID=3572 RepID=A0AAW1M7M9_SAPOF